MGMDRYARVKRLKKGAPLPNKPTPEQFQIILEDYIGEAGAVNTDLSREGSSAWFVVLKGKPSFPFKRIHPSLDHVTHDERWVEVYLEEKGQIRVTTRQADEYTNNVADGIVQMLARFYGRKLDMGG